MNRCAITSAYYYINDKNFAFNNVPDFIREIELGEIPINFCDINKLAERLDGINTRLVDRQSLLLENVIKNYENEKHIDDLEKSETSIVVGSFSSSIYPISDFTLSARDKGFNFVNAMQFTNNVGNAASSRACIWNQFRNKVYALSDGLNSGLNAVINTFDNIRYGNMKVSFACSTEEVGAGALLLKNQESLKSDEKPLAYIKGCDFQYIGNNIDDIKIYFTQLEKKLSIDLNNIDIYLSGDFPDIGNILKKGTIKDRINSKMWSLTTILDIGRCLYEYNIKDRKQDSLIVSIDSCGFVSCVLLEK